MRYVAALVLLLTLLAPARADDLGPEDFLRELERARRAVEDELTRVREGGEVDAEHLRRAGSGLRGARIQTTHGPVDADPALDREVEGVEQVESPTLREEKLDALSKRLRALEREARRARGKGQPGTPAGPSTPTTSQASVHSSPERARDALNRVLERPHYRRRTAADAESSGLAERFESWWQRVQNWWERTFQPPVPSAAPSAPGWLTSLMQTLASLVPTTWIGFAAWGLAVVLLVAVIVLYRSKRKGASGTEAEGQAFEEIDGARAALPSPEESYSEAHWRREARLLADHGDYRGAVRALYTGLLLLLQRGGRLKFDKGKTNWEHLRELRRNDRALATRMEPLTRLFDVVWYGRSSVERGTFDDFLARSDDLAQATELPPADEAAP